MSDVRGTRPRRPSPAGRPNESGGTVTERAEGTLRHRTLVTTLAKEER